MSRLRHSVLLVLPLLLSACASGAVHGPYVWASRLAPEPVETLYQIRAGDDVAITVWGNDALTVKARVRSDGQISMPLLGELKAVDHSASTLGTAIERALTAGRFVNAPRVTVQVEEQVSVSVLGKVVRAGAYPLALATGRSVADALAAAGGLTEFAHKDRIYVLRRTPTLQQIRFRFSGLLDPTDAAARFRLRSGDVVLVD
jgi:polysaccharide export outer membrane protein